MEEIIFSTLESSRESALEFGLKSEFKLLGEESIVVEEDFEGVEGEEEEEVSDLKSVDCP